MFPEIGGEETTWDGVDNYKTKHPVPEYNIGLDSQYPMVIAENGYGDFYAAFKKVASGAGATVEAVTGGGAVNQIPGESLVRISAKQCSAPSCLLSLKKAQSLRR